MTNLCVCPPFKKSFTSGETPGPGLWRLYISIHNWWPGPRQTAHYTCNMDSLLVSDACPRLDLTLSHHCVRSRNGEGMAYVCLHVQECELDCVCVCDMVVTAKNIIGRPCVHQHKFGSCCDCWFQVWFSKFLFLEQFLWAATSCLFCVTLFGSCAPLKETEAQRCSCYLCRFLGTNWSEIQVLLFPPNSVTVHLLTLCVKIPGDFSTLCVCDHWCVISCTLGIMLAVIFLA